MSNEHAQTAVSFQKEQNEGKKATRPRNAKETRAELLAVARLHFARDGYEATNLRDIATSTGVNVALISRYFGSKEGLFQAVIAFDCNRISQVMQGPQEGFGERLLKEILVDPTGSEHDLFITLLRSTDYPPANDYLQKLLTVLETDLAQLAHAPDAELRASLVTALITGMVVLRRLVNKPPLSKASADILLPYFQSVLSALLSSDISLPSSDK